MKTSIVLTLALGLALAGCNKSTRSSHTSTNEPATTTTASTDYTATNNTTTTRDDVNATANRVGNDMRDAANSASNALGNAANNISTTARMTEWKLNASDIQADLDNGRDIIRTKSETSASPTGKTDKSVVDSAVKARLDADSDIAALKLHASADKEGEVTLRGKAHSAEEVGKAIALALDTEGVTKVTSKIKLDKDARTNR